MSEDIAEPIDEPTEDEAPCTSVFIPGVITCFDLDSGHPRPYGHMPPHTGMSPSGSRVTWSTEEEA